MFCSECGKTIDDEALICPECGAVTKNGILALKDKEATKQNDSVDALNNDTAIKSNDNSKRLRTVALILGLAGSASLLSSLLGEFCSITVPTIYNAIRFGIINVKLEDTRRMKYNPKYEYNESNIIAASKIPYSIENRPDEIDNRLIFGHFELDTVIGSSKGKHECLMTLTERKTRFEMIFKLSCKTSEEVVNKFNSDEKEFKREPMYV